MTTFTIRTTYTNNDWAVHERTTLKEAEAVAAEETKWETTLCSTVTDEEGCELLHLKGDFT